MTTNLQEIAKQAAALNAEIKSKSDELAKLKEQLVAGGEADYGCAQVIVPSPMIKPSADAIEELKESLDSSVFSKLFDKVVTYKPVKSFRAVLGAIMPAGAAKKILAKVEAPSTPYVKFA